MSTNLFLDTFKYIEKVNWFPGHMKRGIDLIKSNLDKFDIFIEVRDSRLPYSSLNKDIDNIMKTAQKKKIIIFNKYELCDNNETNKFYNALKPLSIPAICLSSKSKLNFDTVAKLINENNKMKYASVGNWCLIGGYPNVGKSTIINQIRSRSKFESKNKGRVTPTSSLPCKTKSSVGFKVADNLFLIDSPGILVPNLEDKELALKLASIGCIKDKIIGKDNILKYIFFKMNIGMFKKLQEHYKMDICLFEKDSDTIINIMREHFKSSNKESCMDKLLEDFRNGHFGQITLDNYKEVMG